MSASRKRRLRTALIAAASAGVLAGGSLVTAHVAGAATVDRRNCPSTAARSLFHGVTGQLVHEDDGIVGVPNIHAFPSGAYEQYKNLSGGNISGAQVPLTSQSASFCRYDYALWAVSDFNGSHSETFLFVDFFRTSRPFG